MSNDVHWEEDTFMPIYIGLRTLICVFALFGNGLTLYCIRKFHYLHTPTNSLVAGLALADIMTGMLPIMELATYLSRKQTYWIPLCLTKEILKVTSAAANMSFILWIALDRYIHISRPFRYKTFVTKQRVTLIHIITWVGCISNTCMVMLVFSELRPGMSCRAERMLRPLLFRVYSLPLMLCVWVGIIVCYTAIARIAWRHPRNLPGNRLSRPGIHDWRLVRMMAMVPGLFLVCTLPVGILMHVANSRGHYHVSPLLHTAVLFWWTQSWANPLIYAWKSKHYRRAFKRVLRLGSAEQCQRPSMSACNGRKHTFSGTTAATASATLLW